MSLTAEQGATVEGELDTQPADAPASGEQASEPKPAELDTSTTETTEESGEKKPEDKKDDKDATPDAKQAWRAVTIAKNEQVKVAKARQALDQDIARVRQFEGQLVQQEQALEQRARELAAERAELQPLRDAIKSKDLNKLIALGFDYEAFTRDRLDANTPEGIARRARAEVEALRKEREEEQKKHDEQRRAHSQIQEQRDIAQTLVSIIDCEEGARDFPNLYGWEPERIARRGLELREGHMRATKQRTGRAQSPTYEQVIRHMEVEAKKEAEARTQRTQSLAQRKSGNSSDAGSAGKAETSGTGSSQHTPSLNARDAKDRLSPPRPKTEAEIDEECLAELRALTKR